MLKLNLGEWCYVWATIDVGARELLAVWVSWQRNMLHAEAFLKKMLEACIDKPLILVEKGPSGTPRLSKPLDLNGLIRPIGRETALNAGSEQ